MRAGWTGSGARRTLGAIRPEGAFAMHAATEITSGVAAARAHVGENLSRALVHVIAACAAADEKGKALLAERGVAAEATARARFAQLGAAGVIPSALAARLASLAGFETLAARQCQPAEAAMVESVIRNELDALLEFARLAP